MDHSRAATAPGLRTLPRGGWRGEVSAALAVVGGHPRLWLLGMLGFALRGGILLLTLPIFILPTQVEFRFLLGANLGTSGLTPGFFVLAGLAGLIFGLLALLALLAVAMVEASSFEQLADGPGWLEQVHRQAANDGSRTWRRLVRRAYAVQLGALLALMVAAVPLVAAINQAILDEVLRPTSDASIYGRVLFDVRNPLFLFVAAFLLIELFSAAAQRELFRDVAAPRARPSGRMPALLAVSVRALSRPLRSPLRTLAAAAAGWLMWVVVVPLVVGALDLTWGQVEAAFLALPAGGTPPAFHLLALFVVASLLAGAFLAGLLVFGIVSAVRAALWTVAGLG